MPTFLTTTSISAELEKLITSAREEITLISPYLKVNQRIQDFIRDADLRRVRLTVIYGKEDMQPAERDWLATLTTPAELWFVSNLHAKCYMNEAAAIITSMNLYEFSQQNNSEMGLHVTRDEEPDLYQHIKNEAQRLRRMATPAPNASATQQPQRTAPPPRQSQRNAAAPTPVPAPRQSQGSATAPVPAPRQSQPQQQLAPTAYCIRCRSPIPANTDKPFCDPDYRSWERFKKKTYEEKFCHTCGREQPTSMARPQCISCFKRP